MCSWRGIVAAARETQAGRLHTEKRKKASWLSVCQEWRSPSLPFDTGQPCNGKRKKENVHDHVTKILNVIHMWEQRNTQSVTIFRLFSVNVKQIIDPYIQFIEWVAALFKKMLRSLARYVSFGRVRDGVSVSTGYIDCVFLIVHRKRTSLHLLFKINFQHRFY